MKTVKINKPFEIGVVDTEKPVPGEGEALLQVMYCGICGADLTGAQEKESEQIFGKEFTKEQLKGYLKNFLRRFVTQQFKRSCMPDGVKATEISLSPRGGLAMPSDASFVAWMKELED